MVRELSVHDERPAHTQEQIDQVRWEMAYLGAPAPEWYREVSIAAQPSLSWLYEKTDRDPSMAKAMAEWDSYRVTNPLDDRTPRERLSAWTR